ncbi:hypothetical protein ACWDYJ_24645 [Streptomyces sp. NPDC003042]
MDTEVGERAELLGVEPVAAGFLVGDLAGVSKKYDGAPANPSRGVSDRCPQVSLPLPCKTGTRNGYEGQSSMYLPHQNLLVPQDIWVHIVVGDTPRVVVQVAAEVVP